MKLHNTNNSSKARITHGLVQYERLLKREYQFVPSDWKDYEDIDSIKNLLADGESAQDIFRACHYPMVYRSQ